MGPMGTLGVNGTPVGTIFSGNGEPVLATFPIPANLVGLDRIAIRAEAAPYFSYNWFYNEPYSAPVAQPTFSICGVNRDQSVTIRTDVFPINRPFQVLMAPHGTLGVAGYIVGTFNSGPTGVGYSTYPIPLGLQGLDRIAIRIEELAGPHYSYNWIENVTQNNCPADVFPTAIFTQPTQSSTSTIPPQTANITSAPATCDPSYPTVCIPPPPPNLTCDDISFQDFQVVGSDPHDFDRDNNGIGCES